MAIASSLEETPWYTTPPNTIGELVMLAAKWLSTTVSQRNAPVRASIASRCAPRPPDTGVEVSFMFPT